MWSGAAADLLTEAERFKIGHFDAALGLSLVAYRLHLQGSTSRGGHSDEQDLRDRNLHCQEQC